jgi:hypothetical protein
MWGGGMCKHSNGLVPTPSLHTRIVCMKYSLVPAALLALALCLLAPELQTQQQRFWGSRDWDVWKVLTTGGAARGVDVRSGHWHANPSKTHGCPLSPYADCEAPWRVRRIS